MSTADEIDMELLEQAEWRALLLDADVVIDDRGIHYLRTAAESGLSSLEHSALGPHPDGPPRSVPGAGTPRGAR